MTGESAMLEAVAFIEDNLKQDIAVSDMAEAVSYSLYHFCRMFNRVIHHTPYDYLMRRRLSESARELLTTKAKIANVAYAYGFNSPETYSRAFKRVLGMQPHQWKRQGHGASRWLMPRITRAHVRHFDQDEPLGPRLEEHGALNVVGLMTRFEGDWDVIASLWNTVAQQLAPEGDEQTTLGDSYAVIHHLTDWGSDSCSYLAAVQVPQGYKAGRDSPMVSKQLPRLTYAKFAHRGSLADMALTRDYIYHTWLPRSGRRPSGNWEMECYGKALGPVGGPSAEVEIWLPVE